MKTLDNFQPFLDKLMQNIADAGIDISALFMDHIAYQASNDDDYDQLKPDFLEMGIEIKEDMVGGRRVGIFELNQPMIYKDRKIPVIELIAPKADQQVKSAYQHAEFVLPESYQRFMEKYPQIKWNTSSIDQEPYSHLKIDFDDGTTAKFHLLSILDIVKSQL